ncbi:MAG: YDG domain-containing protein, partial [Oscillospiraceae bacterium]
KLIIVVPNTLELMPGALVIADKGKDNFKISGTVTNNAGACDNTTVKGLVGMVDKQLNTVTPDKWVQIDDVTISGNTVYGETLTANITYVVQPDNPIDCEYLWCADDVTISGETSSTLILNDISYIGKKIKVIVWPKIGNVMGTNWRETSTVISEKPDATPDKTKLGDMLKVAAKDAAKVGTIWVQAESEFNAIAHQHYVTKAQVDAYAEAIKAAQAIFDDAKATQKQVDDAQSSIATANATFTAAGQSQVGRMVWFGIDVLDNVTYETTKDGIVYRGVQTQLRFRDVDAKSVLKDTDKVEVSISCGKNENKKVLAYSTSKPGKKTTTEIFNNTIGKVKDCATIFFAPNAAYPSDLWDTTNWTGATIADKPTKIFVSVYRTEYEVLKELNKVETGAKDKYLLISQNFKEFTLNEKFTDATSKNPIAWADVVPKAPTLSFAEAAKSVTYGDAKFTNKATLSEGTDAISYKSSDTSIATVDAATGEVTVLKNGNVTIEATSINTATHIIAAKGYKLTIAHKMLIVRGATPKAKIYDGNTDIVLENCTLDGIVGTDEVTLDTSTATAAAKIGTVAVTKATFTLSGKDEGKYTVAYPPISGMVTISPKALTVKGTTAVEKTYDGKTDVVLIGGTLEGVVGKDVVTLATLTGKAAAANVAAAAVVNTDYTIEGADKANYTIKQPSGVTVNITAKPVTITGVTATKTYDGTTAVTLTGTPALDGVIAADKATATLKASYPTAGTVTSADWTGKPVDVAIGTYALEGAGASNYALTQPTVQVTIAKATLTVPTDTTKPTASEVAKVNDKLSTSIITGTKALCGETVVEGAWAWKDGTIIVDKSGLQTAVFTPTSTNYAPLEAQIQVDVIPAQP